MPRFSKTLLDVNGKPFGIACGRVPHRKCSTPGCSNHASQMCDYPVERKDPPKRGDARVHREHGLIFYVWAVDGDQITIAQSEPGFGCGVLQTVTLADWFAKSSATCDRLVCRKCAVSAGPGKDHCAAHARLAEKKADA